MALSQERKSSGAKHHNSAASSLEKIASAQKRARKHKTSTPDNAGESIEEHSKRQKHKRGRKYGHSRGPGAAEIMEAVAAEIDGGQPLSQASWQQALTFARPYQLQFAFMMHVCAEGFCEHVQQSMTSAMLRWDMGLHAFLHDGIRSLIP